jgi:hypothetical protein
VAKIAIYIRLLQTDRHYVAKIAIYIRLLQTGRHYVAKIAIHIHLILTDRHVVANILSYRLFLEHRRCDLFVEKRSGNNSKLRRSDLLQSYPIE